LAVLREWEQTCGQNFYDYRPRSTTSTYFAFIECSNLQTLIDNATSVSNVYVVILQS
jgi:hypothetical protein